MEMIDCFLVGLVRVVVNDHIVVLSFAVKCDVNTLSIVYTDSDSIPVTLI
jgi:hypothetical protein